MIKSFNTSQASGGALLKGTIAFVRTLKILWITFASLMAFGVVLTLSSGKLKLDDIDVMPAISILLYCAAVYGLIHYVGAIVQSVRKGDPFTPENATRLRTLGWMFLVVGFATWVGDTFEMSEDLFTDTAAVQPYRFWVTGFANLLVNPALLLASPLMFILARVFDAGIAMREDVEGTI